MQVDIERLERQLEEISKHSIDWRFLLGALIPVGLTVGGALISIAIQVNTLGEKMNSIDRSFSTYTVNNRRELDNIYERINYLEQRSSKDKVRE